MCKEVLVCNRCETEEIDDFVFIKELDTVLCILCADYFMKHSLYDPYMEFSFYCDSVERSEHIANLLNIKLENEELEDEL